MTGFHKTDERTLQSRRLPAALLSIALIVGLAMLLASCGQATRLPVTYNITDWSDVQTALNDARNGDTIDLSALWSPSVQQPTFKIPSGLSLTIIGHSKVNFLGVAFNCAGSNTLTIRNLEMTTTNNQNAATLAFSGKNNTLILVGENELQNSKASLLDGFGSAIGVARGAELVIQGAGNLNIRVDNCGAGIGGGLHNDGGSMTIETDNSGGAGQLVVAAYNGGAGIGGGLGGAGGDITINSGTLIIKTFNDAAGIGGGAGGAGGNLIMNGGNLTVQANQGNSIGLGGGLAGAAGTLTMTGGVLMVGGNSQAINTSIAGLPNTYIWWASAGQSLDWNAAKNSVNQPFNPSASDLLIRIEAATVLGIAVTPAALNLNSGSTQAFTANVSTMGGASTDVSWSLAGNNSAQTVVDASGLLTVGADETANSLTITATSQADPGISGSVTVTVHPAGS
ncbi:MAG: hypothetical protein FWC59_00225 [Actinomycetia bacterium]|nr:hypothetical protein [Actinomycetes bacterium]